MASPNINQFKQSAIQGQLDLEVNTNTISVKIQDADPDARLVPGQCVKQVDSSEGVIVVQACDAASDDVFGVINFGGKRPTYKNGDFVEISYFKGNVMFMTSSAAIAAGANVMPVIASKKIATATGGNRIIGKALDKATAADQLIRVTINLPGATA
jgi:hypothetical protein